jgi:hypothetical protein
MTNLHSYGDFGLYYEASDYSGNPDNTNSVVKPKKGYYLMVAHIRVKNGMKERKRFVLNGSNTVMIGEGERTCPPMIFDADTNASATSNFLIPGSALEIKIIFGLQENFKPTAMILTMGDFFAQPEEKTDVRILL